MYGLVGATVTVWDLEQPRCTDQENKKHNHHYPTDTKILRTTKVCCESDSPAVLERWRKTGIADPQLKFTCIACQAGFNPRKTCSDANGVYADNPSSKTCIESVDWIWCCKFIALNENDRQHDEIDRGMVKDCYPARLEVEEAHSGADEGRKSSTGNDASGRGQKPTDHTTSGPSGHLRKVRVPSKPSSVEEAPGEWPLDGTGRFLDEKSRL